jgi:hypothetical protein
MEKEVLTNYYETCGRGDLAAPTVSENVAPLLPEIVNDQMMPVINDDDSTVPFLLLLKQYDIIINFHFRSLLFSVT